MQRIARIDHVDPSIREDVVQETLLRVWARLEERGETGRATALIRTVVRRIKIDLWRRRETATQKSELARREPDSTQPIDDAEMGQLTTRMRMAVAGLPGPQRDVVRMRVVEGRTFAEIAARQKVPLNTALGRMHLALKTLRRELIDDEDVSE